MRAALQSEPPDRPEAGQCPEAVGRGVEGVGCGLVGALSPAGGFVHRLRLHGTNDLAAGRPWQGPPQGQAQERPDPGIGGLGGRLDGLGARRQLLDRGRGASDGDQLHARDRTDRRQHRADDQRRVQPVDERLGRALAERGRSRDQCAEERDADGDAGLAERVVDAGREAALLRRHGAERNGR